MTRRLLFVLLLMSLSILSFNNVYAARNELTIQEVEQLPCFGGARLNVLLSGLVTNHEQLRYSYRIGNSYWHSEQVSSSFTFNESDLNTINNRSLSFRVRDNRNYNYSTIRGIIIQDKKISVDISYSPQNPNCGEANGGGVNALIEGGWRYLIFDGTRNTEVQIPAGFLNNLHAFTIEGDIKLSESNYSLQREELVGTFGIDNILEFGFRRGKPAGYISFMRSNGTKGAFNLTSSYKFPNDYQWHNMVLRSDGRTMEILIDGNIYASDSQVYEKLVSDNGNISFVTIGANVWNNRDRGLNGAVSRVSFWNRRLDNNELKNLRANPPKGSENGLLAAYNLDKKVDKKLLPTLPIGTPNQENYTGNIIGAKWSDKITYTLEKLNYRGEFQYYTSGESSEAVIGNLSDGTYKFSAVYDSGDGKVNSEPYEFTIKSTSILSARISYQSEHALCEGDEIILKVDEVIGGAREGEPTYKWKVLKDGAYEYVQNYWHKFPKTDVRPGVNEYKLLISSGTCVDRPVKLNVVATPKIVTQAIVRK